ncbi:MAG TPA: beta-ketoacyl synthase N-terminal-like domain-containing protein [Candidatus Angelobacter sp.]|nr:beta-ketoacyl synthase N-terminal-like domain-containing protein [Candidatus Angelobacter sp.]
MTASIRYLDARSALGSSLDECVDNLLGGHKPWRWLDFPKLQEPLQLPYFALPESADADATRIYSHLQEMTGKAIAAEGLDEAQRARTGLFIGSSSYDVGVSEANYFQALEQQSFAAGATDALPMGIVGYGKMAERLRAEFKLSPHCYSYSTACTSSANALLYAQRLLAAGLIDNALVIGVEFFNQTTLLGFHSLGLISPSQRLAPFAADRDGLVLGEACALVMLGRPDAAAPIQLELCGGAIATDNHSLTAAIADGSSLASVMTAALAETGVAAGDIKGIKAHGTASLMNDEAEAAALKQLFAGDLPAVFALKQFCGHTLGACGALELALAAGCLLRNRLPSNPGHQFDPALGVALNIQAGAAADGHYLFNCFAFGGNNNALVLRKTSRAEALQ